MERYVAKKEIQILYQIIGAFALGVLAVVLVISPFKQLGLNLASRLIFYALTLLISILHFLRPKRCYLELNDDEIYFHDGLLGRTRVQYDLIKSIDYHPELKFRITLKKNKRRKIEVPNIFTLEDQESILKSLKKKRKAIQINYLIKPESIFVREKKQKNECKRGNKHE